MRWCCAIGLGCLLVAPNFGCSEPVSSGRTAPPQMAKAVRRPSTRNARPQAHCCSPTGEDHAADETSRTPAACDEIDELERRFSGAKPVRVLAGKATYYSDALSGRAMASGEIYHPDCAQAAHRTLPFGTVARVRMVKSGASVVVRITDRGPFAGKGRIIDVSHGAARKLGLLRAGVADVRVEVLQLPKRR